MTAITIVLNGPSSAGKSSLAVALQERWSRPLLLTGIDTFLAGWPENYFSAPDEDGQTGPESTGFRIVPGTGPAPSWVPEPGVDGQLLLRAAHRAWRGVSEAGLDQVVDHVLLDGPSKSDAREVLDKAFWVGIRCDVDELVRRETARGDRFVGFASGTHALVHDGVDYELELDTTSTTPGDLADAVLAALDERR